jgi:S1-C subfamily serine protease
MKTTKLLTTVTILWAMAVVGPAWAEVNEANLRARLLRSTGWVIAGDFSGTGFVLDRQRKLMVTNYHVVADRESVRVIFPHYLKGKLIGDRDFYHKNSKDIGTPARVLNRDPKHDLAVIQLERLPHCVEALSPAESVAAEGETIYRLGSPAAAGETWKLSGAPVVQVSHRRLTYNTNNQQVDALIITSDGPNRPGDSGGPVVNKKGELVGIHAAFSNNPEGKSCAIDLREIKAFLKGTAIVEKPAASGL